MEDLCFGVELIFSSNRIMWLLLFPIQSVTISFVQDQVTGILLMCPRDTTYEIQSGDTHPHIHTESHSWQFIKSAHTGVHRNAHTVNYDVLSITVSQKSLALNQFGH